ncbi:MAG: transglutaminase, partial [Bacteroidota bacterium]
GEIIEENPFKLEKREYPVDYGFPIRKEYNFNFKLPEGYVIEETPAPESLSMKGDAATFSYDISKENPGELIVKADFSINKTMFVQTEYSELKAFYNAMLKKCTEQVVLKKSSGQ